MGAYPTSPRPAFLAWGRDHVEIFLGSAAQIGLLPQQAADFRTAIEALAEADTGQSQARQAALNATVIANMKYAEARAKARATIGLIKSFAEATNNPDVYTIAQIPPPLDPSSLPPPGQPTDMRVEIEPTTGELTLSWKSVNPRGASGTSYIVRRRTTTTGAFEFIGVTGRKKYKDTTLFAGPDRVEYTVQGQRADSTGPVSAILVVNFGRAADGSATPFSRTGDFSVTTYTADENAPSRQVKKKAA